MTGPTPPLEVRPLASNHDRAAFSCGVASLDAYLHRQAGQDMRRRANAVFVLADAEEPARILGFFTLAAFAIDAGEIPDDLRRGFPRHDRLAATLIGRLAVATAAQGQGIGAALLAAALQAAWSAAQTVGSSMVVVDAIDESAAAFYARHGFIRRPGGLRLILPMATVARLCG